MKTRPINLLAALFLFLFVWNASAERPKPNIVLLLTDDLGWQDVKCYDIDEPSPMETPNIDALAKKGMMFWQAYSPAPTCAPSRCAIMSGNHPARAQKTHVVGGAPPAPISDRSRMMDPWYSGRMPENELTIAKVLKQNGYTTGHSGKWHIAIDHNAFPQPGDVGFDWTRSDRGSRSSMKDRLKGFATDAEDDPYRLDENGYPFHQTNEDALTFLRENKDKPFFLYYATWLVHAPIHTRSKERLEKYAKRLGIDPANTPKKETPGQQNPFYCAMVEELDYYIGKVFDYLDETEDPRWPGHKLSENTYLIFTSDNGGMEGGPKERYTDNHPLARGKISAMEGGTRVPLIITGPGIPAGEQTDVMANGLDFYPTILSMAGIQKPAEKHLDGCDLLPFLTKHAAVKLPNGKPRDTMIWHFPHGGALESTIRIGDYKLVRNYDHVNNDSTEPLELYQLYAGSQRVDIEEAKNLAASMPEKAKEMDDKLTAMLTEMGASYPYFNPDSRDELPGKEKVCTILTHEQKGQTAHFTFKENGAKVTRADLIYTKNGGERSEEWFRAPATIESDSEASAEIPNGTTHYFLNLIDENQFLRSYPKVSGRKKSKFAEQAIKVQPIKTQAKASNGETLPPLVDGKAPQTFEEMWAGFDPQAEPLDVEVLKEWEEDGVVMQVLRYRIGIFKGQKSMMAAIYGYPKGGKNLPALLQIHGGGQYADHKAVLTNAKRGYASMSIAWAGRISSPDYKVTPREVQLFWDGATEDPNYRITTDWGALDAYHAPCRNPKNAFAHVTPAAWTLDQVDSPRNNPWFLCTLGARRGLTFLEQQPQVEPTNLGVYGHSMGGKLTVMTAAADDRVKAAAPSCGGISDRPTDNALYAATIADGVNLKHISCPVILLSPSNDFHGRINDLPTAISEITSKDWRVSCSPHGNHQDTAEYQIAGLLWLDKHLKGNFTFPNTPEPTLTLKNETGIPSISVRPRALKSVLEVDIFYTQHGQTDGERDNMENTKNRFWRHAKTQRDGQHWLAELPLIDAEKPLWVYANVLYPLDPPQTGAGYYYGIYTAKTFNLSSLVQLLSPEQLKAASVKATLKPTLVIEEFNDGWEKDWFTYKPEDWPRKTHKVYDAQWHAPDGASLAIEVRSAEANQLVIGIDEYAAEAPLTGGAEWQQVVLKKADFKSASGDPLKEWTGVRELRLGDKEMLRSGSRGKETRLSLGGDWKGSAPEFRSLRWLVGER